VGIESHAWCGTHTESEKSPGPKAHKGNQRKVGKENERSIRMLATGHGFVVISFSFIAF
jgi:hypothetical protein